MRFGANRIHSRKKLSLKQTGKEVSIDTRNDISCLSVATGGGSYILIKSVDMLAGKPFLSKQPETKIWRKYINLLESRQTILALWLQIN